MKISEALSVVGKLAEAFPETELRPGTLKVYAEFLLDLEVKEAEAAILAVIAESRKFPPISAELRPCFCKVSM